MSSTKIINVLKDDSFEELLDIVHETDTSEVIFVLPKKTKAFKTEKQFASLSAETKDGGKSIAFLCSSQEINDLARKFNFDVLSTKTDAPKIKPPKEKVNIKVAVQNDEDVLDADDNLVEKGEDDTTNIEEDDGVVEKDEEILPEIEEGGKDKKEEKTDEDEKDYKKEEIREEEEDEPPYGTKLDDEGNIIYDESEDSLGKLIKNNPENFQIITASTRSRGMSDVIKPNLDKNIKIVQKNKKSIKLDTCIAEEDEIKSVWESKSSDNIWADIPKPNISKKSAVKNFYSFSKFKWNQLLLIVSVIVLVSAIYLTTGSAKIEIKPRPENLNASLKISISSDISSTDVSLNKIPGQLFKINKSESNEFQTTGEKNAIQKSRGKITIYNEYSTSPQPLVATTRFEFLSDNRSDSLIFRTLKTVSVPGMKVENGKITPGKIDVEVIADKAGQDYNVPAGKFGVVTWREKGDASKYEKIYGQSLEPMHGGISGKAKIVSEFDYNKARDQLVEKVQANIKDSLKSQSAGLELLTSIEPEIDSIKSTAKVDDATELFTMTIDGSIITIGFKKEDLINLIAEYIDQKYNLNVIPEKLELIYDETKTTLDNSNFSVTVKIGGTGFAKVDKENISENLVGKNELQIKNYLSSIKEIASAKVALSPFWIKKIPKNKDKIDISLTY